MQEIQRLTSYERVHWFSFHLTKPVPKYMLELRAHVGGRFYRELKNLGTYIVIWFELKEDYLMFRLTWNV